MTGGRTVGAVDALWLNMDRPANLMVIDSVMWFDEPVDWSRLTAIVEQRLLAKYPVFRQVARSSLAGLGLQHWEDDPDFSLPRHLIRGYLPRPGDEAALQAYVEEQMQRPLDRAHPLWEMHLLDGFGDGSAILCRFHHALADGIALAEVLLSLTDDTDEGDLVARPVINGDRVPALRSHAPSLTIPGLSLPGLTLPRVTLTAPEVVGDLSVSAVRRAEEVLRALSRTRPSLVPDAATLTRQVGGVADKLLLGWMPPTVISGRPGPEKRAVWSDTHPLAEVKRIGRSVDATINDVLVAALCGAVNTYLAEHGESPRDLTTMVPVNVRPPGVPLPAHLGNRFALVLLPLPIGLGDPRSRLAETKLRMDSIKRSPEAAITMTLIQAIGRTHPQVAQVLVDFFASKAIGVTTNVAGPAQDRYLAGSRITGVLGWVPCSGQQSLGVCIFSYNQTVRVGFKVDSRVVPDPERLVEAFDAELAELGRGHAA
jgi:WS/DGAT/MGAT family acyltransferase